MELAEFAGLLLVSVAWGLVMIWAILLPFFHFLAPQRQIAENSAAAVAATEASAAQGAVSEGV